MRNNEGIQEYIVETWTQQREKQCYKNKDR